MDIDRGIRVAVDTGNVILGSDKSIQELKLGKGKLVILAGNCPKEIRYIALFESMTGAMVKDLLVDDENGKLTFLVKKGDMGLAIGKRGSTVAKVQKTVDKGVEVFEH